MFCPLIAFQRKRGRSQLRGKIVPGSGSTRHGPPDAAPPPNMVPAPGGAPLSMIGLPGKSMNGPPPPEPPDPPLPPPAPPDPPPEPPLPGSVEFPQPTRTRTMSQRPMAAAAQQAPCPHASRHDLMGDPLESATVVSHTAANQDTC